MLIDTHCHIHESDFPLDRDEVLAAARAADVTKILCVGTSVESSREAVDFAKKYQLRHSGLDPESRSKKVGKANASSTWILNQPRIKSRAKGFSENDALQVFAILGVHPHETANFSENDIEILEKLIRENPEIVKGIGEIGLDYFYEFASRDEQIKALERQLELAQKLDLPISFHVRDGAKNGYLAFADFWEIIKNYDETSARNSRKIRGVLHSCTDQNRKNLDIALAKNFYFGVNGIATFAGEREQNLWREIPLNNMLLETDAPFLAPVPFRGQKNQPAFIPKIVEFLADLRGETYDEIVTQTTKNAEALFVI
jgi:TatD DNase family protein